MEECRRGWMMEGLCDQEKQFGEYSEEVVLNPSGVIV